MSRILITGGNSFLARSFYPELSKNHEVWSLSRKNLDVICEPDLEFVLKKFKPDFVIHTAFDGDSYKNDDFEAYLNNMNMIDNLLKNQDLFYKLIIFGSGVEFESDNFINGNYQLAKKQIARNVIGNDKVIKLNLWNVFGKLEDPRRFISTCIRNCEENKDIVIEKDKWFDFFYAEDLAKIILYLIENPPNKYFEDDCVYPQKNKLSEIAKIIKNLINSQNNIIIKEWASQDYMGDSYYLDKLVSESKICYTGLVEGIKKMI